MTPPAKIDANRRNSDLSTGPRTVHGKAIVASNATKHGIFSSVPVIPGECPERREIHRSGVVDSLAPEGLLEVNLAERAALLLWRLQRLARYEVETMAAVLEDVYVPPLPTPDEEINDDPQQTRDEQLREIRSDLRRARQELAEVLSARDFYRSWQESGGMRDDLLRLLDQFTNDLTGRSQRQAAASARASTRPPPVTSAAVPASSPSGLGAVAVSTVTGPSGRCRLGLVWHNPPRRAACATPSPTARSGSFR